MIRVNMDEPDAQEVTAFALGSASSSIGPDVSLERAAHDQAFVTFYRGVFPGLVAFLRWQGVPLPEAIDVAQETMVQAYQHWTTIHHPRAWTRRVASRMWARRIAQAAEDPVADVPERPSLLAVPDIAAWEQRHDVLQILNQLPARQRQVLAWSLDGYTPTEIAIELKMNADAVRGSLAKARRTLASFLHARGDQQ
jgi:RNA polymerase sigma factor (sigma-70 family)